MCVLQRRVSVATDFIEYLEVHEALIKHLFA